MHERVIRLPGAPLALSDELAREFEACLSDTTTLAFRVAYGVLRQREEAEDVAQEAFVRAYRRFAQLRDRTRFRGWLVRMTWRLAIDRQRSTRRRRAHEAALTALAVDPPPRAGTSFDEHARLWAAIDALPEKLRWVIVLGAIEGYDIRELARLLGVPEGTVKSRLFLARRRLKELLT